jgi:hypothetical protein
MLACSKQTFRASSGESFCVLLCKILYDCNINTNADLNNDLANMLYYIISYLMLVLETLISGFISAVIIAMVVKLSYIIRTVQYKFARISKTNHHLNRMAEIVCHVPYFSFHHNFVRPPRNQSMLNFNK